MTSVETYYLTTPLDSADQAASLATYLNHHGVTAVAELNEVTVPMDDPARSADVHQLRQNWKLYWQHCDAELFSLPVFVKPDSCCQ